MKQKETRYKKMFIFAPELQFIVKTGKKRKN